MGILKKIYEFRSTLILLLTPVLLLPVAVLPPPELKTAFACAYTILLMAVYWVSEVLPLAVTSLLPLVFYPILGVLEARTVSMQYLKDVNVLFLGGLTVAVAVEHWNLHKRIALKVLTKVGAKPRWLLFGFMITTAFLSMWISNVATTAMMVPIAQAVLDELFLDEQDQELRDFERAEAEDNESAPSTSHLNAEIGNIKDAQALGKKLATGSGFPSDEENDVEMNEEYYSSSPASYTSLGRDEGAAGLTSNRKSNDEEEVLIVITKPTDPTPVSSPKMNHSPAHLAAKRPSEVSIDSSNVGSHTRLLSETSQIREFEVKYARQQDKKNLAKALTICVCYSSNIGGTATLTGTGPNLLMAGQFKSTYPSAPEIDYGSWIFFAFPGMFLFLMMTWLWLQYLFLELTWSDLFPCWRNKKYSKKTFDEEQAEAVIKKQYDDLGPMSFAEKSVLILFMVLALLWITRDPGFLPGWGSTSLFKSRFVTDATVAMAISFLLFVFPSRKPNIFCCKDSTEERETGPVPPLLTWKIVQHKMAWNVILLLGGGFAMALGAKSSGLSEWIGTQLTPLNALSPFVANLICCLVICALTQCTSNTSTATIFLPILAELGEVLGVNPLYLMLPATIVTSYAFMLPVSTPPNAIAYSYGHLKMIDMVKAGFLMNIVGVFIALSSVHIFGGLAFSVFENCPDWLSSQICNENVTTNTLSVITSTLNSTIAS